MTDQPMRRELVAALSLLIAGGVLGLAATGWAWGEAHVADGVAESSPAVTGRELLPLGQAVAALALAAVLGVLATRGIGRLLMGTAVALLGLAGAVASYRTALELTTHLDTWATEAGLATATATANPAGPLWNAAAGLLILVAGVWVAVRGPRWPTMGTRYDRTPAERPAGEDLTSRDVWDAIDRGDDPTT